MNAPTDAAVLNSPREVLNIGGRSYWVPRDVRVAHEKMIAALRRINSIKGCTGGPGALVGEFRYLALVTLAEVEDPDEEEQYRQDARIDESYGGSD